MEKIEWTEKSINHIEGKLASEGVYIADPKKGEIYDLDFYYFLFENIPSVVCAELYGTAKRSDVVTYIKSLYSQGYFKKDIIDYYTHRIRIKGSGAPWENIHQYRNRVGIDDSEWEKFFKNI